MILFYLKIIQKKKETEKERQEIIMMKTTNIHLPVDNCNKRNKFQGKNMSEDI